VPRITDAGDAQYNNNTDDNNVVSVEGVKGKHSAKGPVAGVDYCVITEVSRFVHTMYVAFPGT
jgi:hypothetical protein